MCHRVTLLLGSLCLLFAGDLEGQAQCPSSGVAVQVLGSGGPRAGTGRASASYLVWVDGRARVMVDAGGGSFVRFGESGARLADLSLLAISHLHPDHVTDLAGLLWLSDSDRQEPLPLVGPSGRNEYPSFSTFLDRLFDPGDGAFPVLSGTVGGPGRGVLVEPLTIDIETRASSLVLDESGLVVRALPVPHGNVPALAYRVEFGGVSVVFSSDQNGSDPRFVEFSRDATALVMHLAVSPTASGFGLELHATPATVGRVASEASVRQLVLSHFFVHESPEELEAGVAEVRSRYSGILRAADDLACFPLG